MALSDRPVPILATPDPRWLPAFYRVLEDGGVAAPLSAAYPPAELAWFADDLGADTVVVSDDLRPHAAELARGRRVIAIGELVRRGDPAGWPGAVDAARPAVVIYTSGTTGRPKGAVLTWGNLETQTRLLAEAWAIGPRDRLLHALPLHHMHGLMVALLTCARAGAHVELLPRFDAARVIERMTAIDATVWMAVPTMYHRLREHAALDPDAADALAAAARALRLATSGSAALPVGLAEWWRTLHGAVPLERSGSTEIGVVLSNPLERAARRPGSVGVPLPSVEVRIVGDDGRAGDGPGELQVRGPTVFAGYWQRPDATAAAFDADGWFLTGDRAVREGDGSFRLLGRASVDILKSGGFKISALEIEEVLRDHPDVAEVAVVGLPDDALGDRVVAAVVVRAGSAADVDALRRHCRERLAAYQVPRAFVVVAELPRNPLGKVVKPDLVRRLADS